jgi:Leucine-rich repeat (LRR) protein
MWGFDLSHNNLSGPIPPELGNLRTLIASYNNLSGTIPPEMGSLRRQNHLELSHNNLSGTIPPELGNIYYIDLSHNSLSGIIEPEIGNDDQPLNHLDLSSNVLAGPIPATLSNFENLRFLKLSDNPDLTCWETFAALLWAWGLPFYEGPESVCGVEISYLWLPYICMTN